MDFSVKWLHVVKYEVSNLGRDVPFISCISLVLRSRRETYHSSQVLHSVDLYLHDVRHSDDVGQHLARLLLCCDGMAKVWLDLL